MAVGHLMDTYRRAGVETRGAIGPSRRASIGLVHLSGMDTRITAHDAIEPVLTLSQLASHLSVGVQTLYDLRSKGRGPRGFRVGRELRFRESEAEAWLVRLEAADSARHPSQAHR